MGTLDSPKVLVGLLNCPHCRARLVVSWSGHYVRDPFTLKQRGTEQSLRRGNHPIVRTLRDLGTVRSIVLLMFLTSATAIGYITLSGKLTLNMTNPVESVPALPKGQTQP
jgi:hypothetical protein